MWRVTVVVRAGARPVCVQEYDTVPCSVSCDQFQWRAGDWSVCTTLTATDDVHCGPGHQSRSVRSVGWLVGV